MINNKKIGIIGGGQLGVMLLQSAMTFGYKVSVMDNDEHVPASRYVSSFYQGNPMNYYDLVNFGKNLDIITIEKEAVNINGLKELRQLGVEIYPSPETIEIIQDRYLQKQFLTEHCLPVVPGILVLGKEDLEQHLNKLPGCLKKCRFGYDGKGVKFIKTASDVKEAFDEPCILEELIHVKQELAIIVCRDMEGTITCYDPVLMHFREGYNLLDYLEAPAGIDAKLTERIKEIAVSIATAFKLVGILAIEMFISDNGSLYINELSPRPHNSGHHTVESCYTSQFEQLIRIITGMQMGSTKLKSAAMMMNILENGKLPLLNNIPYMENVYWHWYGKLPGKMGRKMGHVTVTGNEPIVIRKNIEIIKEKLKYE